jgi:hypothetical protein
MAHFHGRLGKVQVSTNGGTTWIDIGGVTDSSLKGTKGKINTSDHDSADFEEYIQGRKDLSIDLTCNYDTADAGQTALITNWYADGVTFLVRFSPAGSTAGSPQKQASGFVETLEEGDPNDAQATLTCTIQLSGTVTNGTAS